MRRLAAVALALVGLAGCGNDDEFDYATACERVPDVRDLLAVDDGSGLEAARDLNAAVGAITESTQDADFVDAIAGIGDAQEQLEQAYDVFITTDPTDQTGEFDRNQETLYQAMDVVVARYREALREARSAGIEKCGRLASVEDLAA